MFNEHVLSLHKSCIRVIFLQTKHVDRGGQSVLFFQVLISLVHWLLTILEYDTLGTP